ncbi:MAG: GyrI-like domain-containing protein [Beijerinckiaceae bacterium]|nr:GyrI-like domain-containing protein [Beijerinckiaceae bacterium]
MTTVNVPAWLRSLSRLGRCWTAAAMMCLLPAFSLPVLAQTAAPAQEAATAAAVTNLVEVESRPALTFDGQSNWDDAYTSITNGFQRLKAEVERAGLKPAGRPVAMFLFTDDAGFRFRAMLPLSEAPVDPTLGAEFAMGKTPAGRAAKFEHRGAYDEIDATYEAITAWLDDKNLLAEDFFAEEWVAEGSSAGDIETAVDVYVFVKPK